MKTHLCAERIGYILIPIEVGAEGFEPPTLCL